MLSIIFKLVKAKWIFKKPNKKNILIYDRESTEIYSIQFFSRKKNYEILDTRYESINIYVLCLTLLTSGIRNFRDNYKKIFIKLVSPKIVYTCIDNNLAFYKLKNIYDRPKYISIQNGMRNNSSFFQNDFYKECKHYIQKTNKKLKVDHVFLFGQNDKKNFSHIVAANTHVVGSPLNNHFSIQPKKSQRKINSIMFISQYTLPMLNKPDLPYNIFRQKKEKQIFSHLVKFCKKKNIQLNFLAKTYNKKYLNEAFFRNYLEKGNWIFHPHENIKRTYETLNKQQMVVFHGSTLGFEALAKSLRCACFIANFPVANSHVKYPKSGPFWTNSNNYSNFEKTINRVIGFSNKRWKKIVDKYSAEILIYDRNNDILIKNFKRIISIKDYR